MRVTTSWWERFWRLAFLVWAANFVVFFALTFYLGGDAWNGHVTDGRYFLAGGGEVTEVSRPVLAYSWWHMGSVFWTGPVMMFAALWVNRKKRRR